VEQRCPTEPEEQRGGASVHAECEENRRRNQKPQRHCDRARRVPVGQGVRKQTVGEVHRGVGKAPLVAEQLPAVRHEVGEVDRQIGSQERAKHCELPP
jgi:hypothetical protein